MTFGHDEAAMPGCVACLPGQPCIIHRLHKGPICERCRGTGRVYYEGTPGACPHCGGTGLKDAKVRSARPIPVPLVDRPLIRASET
jgi:DnaJ-class molecular chaperone